MKVLFKTNLFLYNILKSSICQYYFNQNIILAQISDIRILKNKKNKTKNIGYISKL